MSHTTPEDGEVWQDSEGLLLAIFDEGRMALTFGTAEAMWIKHLDPADKPSERVFDREGNFVGPARLNSRPSYMTAEEYREETRRRKEAYDANCAAAGLVKVEHGDHNHYIPSDGSDGGDVDVVVVEMGPDGPRRVSASDPDVPEPIRRMIQAAQSGTAPNAFPNSFG